MSRTVHVEVEELIRRAFTVTVEVPDEVEEEDITDWLQDNAMELYDGEDYTEGDDSTESTDVGAWSFV